MSRLLRYLVLLFFISCNSNASENLSSESEAFPFTTINEKILFIGNSFTFYWNLPSQVERMSIERGLNWDIKHFTVPAATLKILWNNPDLKSILESETFDHVIIQEHSTNILTNANGNSGFYFGQITSLIPDSTQIHFFSTWTYPSMEQYNINNEEYPIEESIKQIIEGTTAKLFLSVGHLNYFKTNILSLIYLWRMINIQTKRFIPCKLCNLFSLKRRIFLNLSKRYKGLIIEE